MNTNNKPAPADEAPTPEATERDSEKTLPSRHHEPEPRLPHERDQSSDSQEQSTDNRGEQAAKDLKAGLQDTGRGPVVEEIARKHFPSADQPAEPGAHDTDPHTAP